MEPFSIIEKVPPTRSPSQQVRLRRAEIAQKTLPIDTLLFCGLYFDNIKRISIKEYIWQPDIDNFFMNQIASSVPTNHAPSRLKPIEELLIQKGHLKPEDLITAKLYQENQKNSGIHLTLGESLSAMDIQVRQTAYQVEFLLIYHEIVTTEQLNAAFRMRKTLQEKGVDKPIGQICVDELKIITQDELEKVLSQHREITPGKHRAKIVTVDTFLDSENPKIDTPVHQEKLKLGDALVA